MEYCKFIVNITLPRTCYQIVTKLLTEYQFNADLNTALKLTKSNISLWLALINTGYFISQNLAVASIPVRVNQQQIHVLSKPNEINSACLINKSDSVKPWFYFCTTFCVLL